MKTLFDLRKNQDETLYQNIQRLYQDLPREPLHTIQLPQGSITPCIGCWSCWLKTPGQCVFNDSMAAIYPDYINSETVILLLDTAQGFINYHAKAFLDRTIPHYHPYIEMKDGECHHIARYDRYPDMVFYYETESLTKQEDEIIEDYLWRTAYHYKSNAYRIVKKEGSDSVLLEQLNKRKAKNHSLPFSSAEPIDKLVIYNGSPRKSGSNSGIILNQVVAALGEKVEIRDLKENGKWQEWSKSFAKEKHVMFLMPLYVHAMPSHVMNFIEQLPVSEGTLSFFVQSGFPESGQSHYLEAYFEKLAPKLGRSYLGTAIKGGMEGLQMKPSDGQEEMILPLVKTIVNLIEQGRFSDDDIKKLAKPVRFGKVIETAFNYFGKRKVNSIVWDPPLKVNGAYDKHYDRPHLK